MTTFVDRDGTARLAGEILMGGTAGDVATVQADGTLAPAATPAAAHTQEFLSHQGETIADNGILALAWTKDAGDTLLDLTVPALPTIVTTGVYVFNVQVTPQALTAGGYFTVQLELDVAAVDWAWIAWSPPATGLVPSVSVAATMYLTAGMEVKLSAVNRDGVAARDFDNAVLLQRVS